MKWWAAFATLFGVALLVETTWFRHVKSVTFDETIYLSGALQTLHDGRLDPRLAAVGVAPLPILLEYLVPLSFAEREKRPSLAEGKLQDARLIDGPRLSNSILVGLPLLLIVSAWLYRRRGLVAAAVGAGLVAFSPSIIAHAALATTDACFAMCTLLALASLAWYFSRPTRPRFAVMAAAIATAMAAKYSGAFLLPVAAILFVMQATGHRTEDGAVPLTAVYWKIALKFSALLVVVATIWWGLHLFSFTGPLKNLPLEETPDSSPWVRMLGRSAAADTIMRIAHEDLRRPAPFDGVLYQYLHNRGGHSAFLMGRRSVTGWWYFFPVAMLIKSTPVELLLLTGSLLLAVVSRRAPWRRLVALDIEMRVIVIAAAVYSALLLTSRINIGHRYLLPLYPLLILAGVDRLWEWLGPRRKTKVGIAVALVMGQAASCLTVAPHYLAYFNAVVGGPQRGWHYLVDSSIDWGQDLPALSGELKRLGYQRVALQYFGTADPRAYGIRADRFSDLAWPVEPYEAIAVSVTNLQGLYLQGEDPFRELRQAPSVGRAGYSILIFDLSDRRTQHALRKALLARPSHAE